MERKFVVEAMTRKAVVLFGHCDLVGEWEEWVVSVGVVGVRD